jgi:hypothetical protein
MKVKINLKGRISFISMFMIVIVLITIRFIFPPTNVLSWDVFGYYLYLPAKLIYHDLGLTDHLWINKLINHYQNTGTLYQAYVGPSGQWVMKYSMGIAILYLPFFFIAHFLCGILGFPPDGLSMPYQYGLAIGGLFYTVIGLIFFRKILLKFFNDRVTTLVMIVTVFGTNYINLTTTGNLLAHNFLFTLFAIFIWSVIKWSEEGKIRYVVLLSFISGLMTLIRPNEVVCLIIPIFWGVHNIKSINEKVSFFGERKWQLLIGSLCFIIVLLPQFYYWKKYTGSYVFYSYPNPGEGLDFLSPHIGNFLLSFRKGWFIYSPIVIFYLIGLVFLARRKKDLLLPVIYYLLVSLYVISSWTCWWYAGGCYSQRAVLSIYLVLALGIGFLLEKSFKVGLFRKIIVCISLITLVLLNIFQFWQFNRGILDHERMTKDYYLSVFGKTRIPDNSDSKLLVTRSTNGFEKLVNEDGFLEKRLGYYSFSEVDNSFAGRYIKDREDTNKYCLVLDSSCIYSPGLTMKYKNITGEYYAWIRGSVEIMFPLFYKEDFPLLVFTFNHKGKCYKYFTGDLRNDKSICDKWLKYSFDYQTPEVRDLNDDLKVYVWHRAKMPILVKNLLIESFEPKVE